MRTCLPAAGPRALLALACFLVPPAAAQDPGIPGVTAPSGGLSREAMWPAPTAEDWKRPCLIRWQRSYEDALAVSQATGKPIIVCVNMDGEIASEHYAGIRYRQPETAALYEPYVCVIASVYRHNPRDYDELGRRILCPRFGSVTCGEHIAIEPGLFDKFMDGKRIAPRHIGVNVKEGSAELYDVYYAWDTDSVFTAIREGSEGFPKPPPDDKGDRSPVELVESPDNDDRDAVEAAFQRGDGSLRVRLLTAAVGLGARAPLDLLRLAIFDAEPGLAALARQALVQSESPAAIDLIAEALRTPLDPADREALIAALERLGSTMPRAHTLALVQRGLATRSTAVDGAEWSSALGMVGPPAPGLDAAVAEARLDDQDRVLRSEDAQAHLQLAEAFVAQAHSLHPDTEKEFVRLAWMDARQAALEAEQLGATGGRVSAVIALADVALGQRDEALGRAEAALSEPLAEPLSADAATLLALFAESRQQAIAAAVQARTDWPAQWLADVDAAYSVLAQHPEGTDVQVAMHCDILAWLGAPGQAARALDEGLQRFPDSPLLHERLRRRVLQENRLGGIEAVYESMLASRAAEAAATPGGAPYATSTAVPGAGRDLQWFAGYASREAAEYHRRAGRVDEALAAYDRDIAHFEQFIATEPERRASADAEIALALAGRARLAFERGDDEAALAALLASFERSPESAGNLDGLNTSAADTSRLLMARLEQSGQSDSGQSESGQSESGQGESGQAGRDDLRATLQAALGRLDPKVLAPPEYERVIPGTPGNDGRPPRRRGVRPGG